MTYGAWANTGQIVHSINEDEEASVAIDFEEGQKNLVRNFLDSNCIFSELINNLKLGLGNKLMANNSNKTLRSTFNGRLIKIFSRKCHNFDQNVFVYVYLTFHWAVKLIL